MAQIPVGGFGFETPHAAPGADTSAIGRGLEVLGQGLAVVARQQSALARMKAANADQDDDNQVKELQKSIQQRLNTGELSPEEAQATFEKELSKTTPQDLSGVDRVAAEALKGAAAQRRYRARTFVASEAAAHQVDELGRQTDELFDTLATQSTIPDADSKSILGKGAMAAEHARQAGVPAEIVTNKMDELRARVARSEAMRNPQAALDKLSTPNSGDATFDALTYQHRQEVTEFAKSQLVKKSVTQVMGTLEAKGPGAGARALAEVERSTSDPELKDDIRANVNQQVSQLRTQRRVEHADEIASVESDIATDTAGRETRRQVDDLFTVGALSPSEYAGYHAQIDQNTVRRATNDAAARELLAAMQGGLPLDPHNPEHRKALSAAFQMETQGAQPTQQGAKVAGSVQTVQRVAAVPVGSQPWQSIAIAYADRARMLPDQAIAWTRGALRSPNAELAASAAQFYGAVDTASPDATSGFDEDTKVLAATINSMVEAGTAPAEAVATARKNLFELKPEIREQRQREYTQFAKGSASALESFIDRDFDPSIFSAQPGATAALKADFDAQAARYYTKVGDIKLARDLAWSDLKHVYGPTRVNGAPMLTAFPVERFGVKPDEVRKDIADFLAGNPQADGSTVDEVLVVPDGLTLRAAADALSGQSVQPSYTLVGKSGDVLLDRDGVRARYTVPNGEELAKRFRDARAKAAAEAQRTIDQAKLERELRRRLAEPDPELDKMR